MKLVNVQINFATELEDDGWIYDLKDGPLKNFPFPGTMTVTYANGAEQGVWFKPRRSLVQVIKDWLLS